MKKLILSLCALAAIGCTTENDNTQESAKPTEYIYTTFYEHIVNGSTMEAHKLDNTCIIDYGNKRVVMIGEGANDTLPMYSTNPVKVTAPGADNEAGTKNFQLQVVSGAVRLLALDKNENSFNIYGMHIFSNK